MPSALMLAAIGIFTNAARNHPPGAPPSTVAACVLVGVGLLTVALGNPAGCLHQALATAWSQPIPQ